ncbi:MAG: S1C family serine protease [Succinivibrio sp.]
MNTKTSHHSRLISILTPVIAGVIIGALILFFKPETWQQIGKSIYSSRVEAEGYSYAVNIGAPSVVNIYVATLNEDYTRPDNSTITSSASGVILHENGIIVTNYHVVPSVNEPDKAIWVQTRDGMVLQAFVVGCDRRTDLAVLKVNANSLKPITPAKKDPNIGDIVLAIGNPNNLGQTVTHGIISALSRSGTGLLTHNQMNLRQGVQELIQTDAPINQGNSGGALINTRGELIGINTASFGENTHGIGFAVPAKLVLSVTDEIIRHGKVERGYLGISDDISPDIMPKTGVRVGYVDPKGPAFGILKVGDVILSVDDTVVSDTKTLIGIISKSKPGHELKLEIERNMEKRVFKITLAEDNPLLQN